MSAPAENVMRRLEGVRQRGAGRWLARCPAHDDRGPSLSVQETDDQRVLIHCFAGCEPLEVCAAIGLTLADLFPARPDDHQQRRGRAKPIFTARDVLLVLDHESLIVAAIASNIAAGREPGAEDVHRLTTARQRIERLREVVG